MKALIAWLKNEPIVTWLGSVAGLTALVQLATGLHWLTGGVAALLTTFLVAAGVGAAAKVRSIVTGPVATAKLRQQAAVVPTVPTVPPAQ